MPTLTSDDFAARVRLFARLDQPLPTSGTVLGDVDLEGLRCERSLNLTGWTFQGNLNLDHTRLGADLNVESCQIDGMLSIRNASVDGLVILNSTRIRGLLFAQGLTAGGVLALPMDDYRFEADEVLLRGAAIKGQVVFDGARIDGQFDAEGLAAGGVFATPKYGHRFEAGGVSLLGAEVRGQIFFSGASVARELSCGGLRARDLWLDVGVLAEKRPGRVTTHAQPAEVGQLSATGLVIGGLLVLDGIQVRGDALLSGTVGRHATFFHKAAVHQALEFQARNDPSVSGGEATIIEAGGWAMTTADWKTQKSWPIRASVGGTCDLSGLRVGGALDLTNLTVGDPDAKPRSEGESEGRTSQDAPGRLILDDVEVTQDVKAGAFQAKANQPPNIKKWLRDQPGRKAGPFWTPAWCASLSMETARVGSDIDLQGLTVGTPAGAAEASDDRSKASERKRMEVGHGDTSLRGTRVAGRVILWDGASLGTPGHGLRVAGRLLMGGFSAAFVILSGECLLTVDHQVPPRAASWWRTRRMRRIEVAMDRGRSRRARSPKFLRLVSLRRRRLYKRRWPRDAAVVRWIAKYRRVPRFPTLRSQVEPGGERDPASAAERRREWHNFWADLLQVLSFNGMGRPLAEPEPAERVVLERAEVKRFQIDRPFPAAVDLSNIRVDRWSLGDRACDYLELLEKSTPFRMSNYWSIERHLRNRGDDEAADAVIREMMERERTTEQRWLHTLGYMLIAPIGYGTELGRVIKVLAGVCVVAFCLFWWGFSTPGPYLPGEAAEASGLWAWRLNETAKAFDSRVSPWVSAAWSVPHYMVPIFELVPAPDHEPRGWLMNVARGLRVTGWVALPLLLAGLVPKLLRKREFAQGG
ncbi:MAG: hypothetical protein AAF823_12895 [Planctomycetota bacterium]